MDWSLTNSTGSRDHAQSASPSPRGNIDQFYGSRDSASSKGCGDCLRSRVKLEGCQAEMEVMKADNKELRDKLELAERGNMGKDVMLSDLGQKFQHLEEEIKAAQTGEVDGLRSSNLQLKKESITHSRELDQMKGLMNELYFEVGGVLKGMGGTVPPANVSDGKADPQSLKELCAKLRSQYSLWQESHEFMHSELDRAMEIIEGLEAERNDAEMTPTENTEVDFDEDPSSEPPLCTIVSTISFADPGKDSNQVDISPLPSNSSSNYSHSESPGCSTDLPRATCVPCEDCEQGLSRLARITSKLAKVNKNKQPKSLSAKLRSNDKKKAGTSKSPNAKDKNKNRGPQKVNENAASSSEMTQTPDSQTLNLDVAINLFRVDFLTEGENSQEQNVEPQALVFDPSGVEHTYAGVCTIKSPSDLMKSLSEDPLHPMKRYFCKCGRSYSDPADVDRHINSGLVQRDVCSPSQRRQ